MSTPVRRALYGRLSGDVTLNALLAPPVSGYAKSIYHDEAPQGATFPYVVFSKSSGVPTQAFRTPSAFETDIWLFKAIDKNTSADTAEAISARIQTLLNDGPLSISGGTVMHLRRESDVEYSELVDGASFRHSGSLYRLVWESA